MKRIIKSLVAALILCGCSTDVEQEKNVEEKIIEKVEQITIKQDPDKYTTYMKNYVGKNCGNIGYTSLGGERRDYIGESHNILLRFVTENGEYIGTEEENLKKYFVVAQSIDPNTEIKMTYEVDEEGNEYDNLIEWASVQSITLRVSKVGQKSSKEITKIKVDPDKYTSYVQDYVGRNLTDCGYVSLAGDYRDYYGEGNVKLILNSADGSYVDLQDKEALKQYYVVAQNIEPNTEMKFSFMTDLSGEEINLVDSQSIQEIELTLQRSSEN